MLLSDLNKNLAKADSIIEGIRNEVFKVVNLSEGFLAVIYLSEDNRTISMSILNSLFIETTLEHLPAQSLYKYAKLRGSYELFLKGDKFEVEEDIKLREGLLKHLRHHRKGSEQFTMINSSGEKL